MKRNHLIDGWRGVSVACVIAGHLVSYRFSEYFHTESFHVLLASDPVSAIDLAGNIVFRLISPLAGLGVDIFFVISGYLITKLLLEEEAARGSISIKAFYVRRVCRIMPAFYTYLLTIYVLSAFGAVHVSQHAFLWSGLFLCDLPAASCTWWLVHTWSLSVEEQFYLVWPLAFFMLGKRRRPISIGLFFVGLLCMSFAYPMALRFSCIAIGALYASSAPFRAAIDRLANWLSIALAASMILVESYIASFSSALSYIDAARPVLLAIIFFGTVNGAGPFVRIVAMDWLRRVGLVSYSLYLWQEISTGSPALHGVRGLLLIPVLFVVPAILSYFIIERPIIRIGHRLSDSIVAR